MIIYIKRTTNLEKPSATSLLATGNKFVIHTPKVARTEWPATGILL
jgi:hypothetical protein